MNASEHHIQGGSQLKNWIEHELIHLAAQEQEEILETDIPDRNLSLRMPIITHLMLYRIAQKLSRSKTATSEEILTQAVRDVYKQFDLPTITMADIEEYAALTEKQLAENASRK